MEKLQVFLLVFQIIIAVMMIIAVLLQKSDGDSLSGIGGGSGGLGSVVSSKTSASILSKITMVLIGIFMLNCLVLASLYSKTSKSTKLQVDEILDKESKDGTDKPLSNQNKVPEIPLAE